MQVEKQDIFRIFFESEKQAGNDTLKRCVDGDLHEMVTDLDQVPAPAEHCPDCFAKGR